MIVEKKTFITAMLILLTAIIGVIFNSPIVCRACVLLLFIICILRGMREKYLLNPYYMFALVPFTLLIYANISNYHLDLTVNTWLIAIINIAAFVIALDFTPEYKHLEKCKGVGEGRQLVEHTITLLVLGFMPTVYTLVLGDAMPLASIVTLFSSGAIVCALKSRNKVLIGIVCFVFIISWIGYVSKSSVLTFAIAILISYEKYYVESAKQKRRLVVLAVLALLLMIVAFSFANQGRENRSGINALKYYTTYGGLTWNRNASLLMPYMYMTTPWTNLQFVLQTQPTHTYGMWLIKPIISYFQLDGFFNSYYRLSSFSNFNTFTFITYNFKDFGFWGSCISSVFLGYYTKKVYSRYRLSKSPLDVVCYVLVAQAVLELFFSNHFFTQSYPFTIVIIMGLYKMIFCKNNDAELEDLQ